LALFFPSGMLGLDPYVAVFLLAPLFFVVWLYLAAIHHRSGFGMATTATCCW
jgi:hypothetical protein